MVAGVLSTVLLTACGGGDDEADTADTSEDEGEASSEEMDDAAGDATDDATLELRLIQDIANLDPAVYPASVDDQVASAIYEGLVMYDPESLDVHLALAETFEQSEDGLEYDFTLKEGIQFHGGYGEVTAEDVKYSFERIAGLTDPPLESTYRGDWGALEEVQVHDDYSGTIVLEEPFSPLMTSTLPIVTGSVISKEAAEELGEDFGTQPIGTGPYEFVSWTPGTEVILERFDDYGGANEEFFDGEVHFETIRFVPMTDASAANIALETQDVDFSQLSLDSIERFEQDENIVTTDRTTLDYNWVGMNMEHPKLEDPKVREAIRYAIDVPGILESAFEGRWTRATGVIAPDMPIGYWEDAPVYEQDLDRSRELLEEAGVEDLTLTFTYTEEIGSSDVAEIVQANLAEVGIQVDLDLLDTGTFYELDESLRDQQLFYLGYVTQPDPSWSTAWFICSQQDEWNWMYWCDEEFDRLHEEAIRESDPDVRQEMYEEMQRLWDEAIHTVWLGWPTLHFGHTQQIEPAITPFGRVRPAYFRLVE